MWVVLFSVYFNEKMIEKVFIRAEGHLHQSQDHRLMVSRGHLTLKSFALGQTASLKALQRRKEMGCWDCTELLLSQA